MNCRTARAQWISRHNKCAAQAVRVVQTARLKETYDRNTAKGCRFVLSVGGQGPGRLENNGVSNKLQVLFAELTRASCFTTTRFPTIGQLPTENLKRISLCLGLLFSLRPFHNACGHVNIYNNNIKCWATIIIFARASLLCNNNNIRARKFAVQQ